MRSTQMRKALVFSLILSLVVASAAFARGGNWGDRGGPRMDAAEDMGPGSGYGPGRGYNANLTDEQRAALTAARESFFAETRELREQMREKRWALSDELAKPAPDAATAAQLQSELSQLQSQFDQSAINHKLEVRQILPDDVAMGSFGRGNKRGGMRGTCWR